MVSFPYHSHIFRDSYGSGMGIVWEASHKGVPLLGVPGITLEYYWRTIFIFGRSIFEGLLLLVSGRVVFFGDLNFVVSRFPKPNKRTAKKAFSGNRVGSSRLLNSKNDFSSQKPSISQ